MLARAFWGGADRFGFKLVHYSVQGNHLHLLVEARDERALSRGMNGLGVRVARGLNRVMRRHGRVLADRYHAHILRIADGGAARARVLAAERAASLRAWWSPDPYTSTTPVIEPDTFLMRRLC